MTSLTMTADEVLSTTRAVRRRLDLDRPVPESLIHECLQLALQAPSAGNRQWWRFLVITDPAQRTALGELYRRAHEADRFDPDNAGNAFADDPVRSQVQRKIYEGVGLLAESMPRMPAILVPCLPFRVEERRTSRDQARSWGGLLPAVWSFMLAARARGLGTTFTTIHLMFEEEAAEILGIPYADVTQACLIPIAHTVGTDFQPAKRQPVGEVAYHDRWGTPFGPVDQDQPGSLGTSD